MYTHIKEHHKATAATATNIIVPVVVFSSIYVIEPFLLEFKFSLKSIDTNTFYCDMFDFQSEYVMIKKYRV